MILIIWVVIAMVVLLSALLIYMEHEWGLVLGGSTAAILIVSYFATELLVRSPLVILLPQGLSSHFDIMATTAGALLMLVLMAITYFAGRRNISGKKR